MIARTLCEKCGLFHSTFGPLPSKDGRPYAVRMPSFTRGVSSLHGGLVDVIPPSIDECFCDEWERTAKTVARRNDVGPIRPWPFRVVKVGDWYDVEEGG